MFCCLTPLICNPKENGVREAGFKCEVNVFAVKRMVQGFCRLSCFTDFQGALNRPLEQPEGPTSKRLRQKPHCFWDARAIRTISSAILSGERTRSMHPVAIALAGISGTPAVSSLCAIVVPPTSLIAHNAAAPSPS